MKRLIAIILALSLIFIYFAVAVSATEITNTMTSQEYYAAQAYLVAQFKDGNITYSEFQERSQAVTDEFVEANTVGGVLTQSALTASNTFNAVSQKIGEIVSNFGDSAKDYMSDWLSDFLDDYAVFNDVSTTDKQGYGALAIFYPYNNETSMVFYLYANDYGTYNFNDGLYTITAYGGGKRDYYYKGNYNSTSNFSGSYSVSGYNAQFFGDWRDPDDTTVILPTDDEFTTVKDYDFSDTSEQDLQELLNKILEELERQQPDLSTVEGLLKSIYNRLGKLDSDNDNALLNDLNLAILSLMKSNDDNAKEIAEALLGIREDLKNGSSDSSVDSSDTNSALGSHNHDTISGTLYNVKPLDKNFFNKLFTDATELKVEYDGKNYFLEPCGCLKIDDKYYTCDMNYDFYDEYDYDFSNDNVDLNFHFNDNLTLDDFVLDSSYDIESSVVPAFYSMRTMALDDTVSTNGSFLTKFFGRTQQEKINKVVDLIKNSVDIGLPYEQLQSCVNTFEGVLFTQMPAEDLIFHLSFNFGDSSDSSETFEITLLSTDLLYTDTTDSNIIHGGIDHGGGGSSGNRSESGFYNAMQIVRDFSSLVIGVVWVLNMRRKVTSII